MEHLGSSFFHQQNFLRQPFKLYNIKKLSATQKKMFRGSSTDFTRGFFTHKIHFT